MTTDAESLWGEEKSAEKLQQRSLCGRVCKNRAALNTSFMLPNAKINQVNHLLKQLLLCLIPSLIFQSFYVQPHLLPDCIFVPYQCNSAVMVDTTGEWPQFDGASWNVSLLRLLPLQLGTAEAEDVCEEAERSSSWQ